MSEPEILYNGQCPVCRAGAVHYQRSDADAFASCGWTDVTHSSEALARHGVTLNAVKYRIHAVDGNGRVLAGMPAVIAIWDRMPRNRWMATLARLPVLNTVATLGYEAAAAGLYVWNRANDR